jgi:hypothetical protein
VILKVPPLSLPVPRQFKLVPENNTTVVTGESYMDGTPTTMIRLDLPFEKVVGRLPNPPLERDIVISDETLREFAEKIWTKQGLMEFGV